MIAGGSRGLGLGIATALAREGAVVAVAGRDGCAAVAAAQQIRAATGAESESGMPAMSAMLNPCSTGATRW